MSSDLTASDIGQQRSELRGSTATTHFYTMWELLTNYNRLAVNREFA